MSKKKTATVKPVTSLTIDRRRWKRGESKRDVEDTSLRTESGQMCCLGFLAIECGFRPCDIKQIAGLDDLDEGVDFETAAKLLARVPALVKIMPVPEDEASARFHKGLKATELHGKLVTANDAGELKPVLREKKLTELFARAGIKLRFKG